MLKLLQSEKLLLLQESHLTEGVWEAFERWCLDNKVYSLGHATKMVRGGVVCLSLSPFKDWVSTDIIPDVAQFEHLDGGIGC